jgi:hypothetical protein
MECKGMWRTPWTNEYNVDNLSETWPLNWSICHFSRTKLSILNINIVILLLHCLWSVLYLDYINNSTMLSWWVWKSAVFRKRLQYSVIAIYIYGFYKTNQCKSNITIFILSIDSLVLLKWQILKTSYQHKTYILITSRLKENHHVYVLCSNLVKYQCQGQNTSIPICREVYKTVTYHIEI